MKKHIFSAILAMLCFVAYAQDGPIKKSDIGFGFKGGMNVSFITGDGTDNFDSKIAFHIGVVSEIPISENFSFQPEILYSAQGDKETFEGTDVKYKLDYLNVPLMVKYYIYEGFSLEVGPQLGFLLSSKAEGDGVSIDLKDMMNTFEFAMDFGLGYKFENGINLAARYNLGVSNIVKNNGSILGEPMSSDNSKNHNEVVQVSVGYLF